MKEDRNVNVITDLNGKKVVIINDICFYGKQHIPWKEVEEYIKSYVDDFFKIEDTNDMIYIGKDFPGEYAWSEYTKKLRGTLAKVKANMAQGIPEIIEIAEGKRFVENYKVKHNKTAEKGWYRYDTQFALPTYHNDGSFRQFNLFAATLIVRYDKDSKLYLYDIINIKKKKQSRPPK